jgi:hypothetical protein
VIPTIAVFWFFPVDVYVGAVGFGPDLYTTADQDGFQVFCSVGLKYSRTTWG